MTHFVAFFVHLRRARLVGIAFILGLGAPLLASAQDTPGWSGNMARNPGFEEDFVNIRAEGHVLSFKGDWCYNQQDQIPDYWNWQKGAWTWLDSGARGGRRALRLEADAAANQIFPRAVSHSGGGAWGGVNETPIPVDAAETVRFNLPWRASVWVRGGGSLTLGPVTVAAQPGGGWQQIVADCPADKVPAPGAAIGVTLTGPGEFDDLVVQEKLPDSPNLAPNASFETVAKNGAPTGWSEQKKWNAIGPTYYVWTDWDHAFRTNRGTVTVDPLVSHSGAQSLRFDVLPGDEKYVESDLIELNQDKPRVIEVAAYVRADCVRLLDVRCVDEEGVHMPAYRPVQPENYGGGSALFGNGTFGWRYVRKFFATPNGRAVKGVRARLCARGFNGHTLDDADTRPYSLTAGTVWWDDVRVYERTSDAAAARARRVTIPPDAVKAGELQEAELDLGERAFGDNLLSYSFLNKGSSGSYRLRLKTTLPGQEPVVTESPAVSISAGQRGTLEAPYAVTALTPDFQRPGALALELLLKDKPVAAATYALHTWPVTVDIDVSRHYNLPNENPVTVGLNLGVASRTLAQVKSLELELYRPADKKTLGTQKFSDLAQAFAQTRQALPADKEKSYEFNLPTPAWWADRRNLIVTKLDLAALKVWPHDEPTRDTVLIVRGLDGRGRELFRQQSAPFGRMQQRPNQDAIQSVVVREDGALLINGKPRYLIGASHQNTRTQHGAEIMAQLGLMGLRLPQGVTYAELRDYWTKFNLYALQMKPVEKQGGVDVVVDMTPEQRKAFEGFVLAGGMQNIVSINSGGWEGSVDPHDTKQVATHVALNDWIRKVAKRPVVISTSGAYNAWWLPKLSFYDMNHGETEMWGPMDFNVIFTPYMKREAKRPTTWVYLPQLYDNTPYERYRFETYDNILRGACGVSMIQGIGDPTFNRGLAGELRGLEAPLNSQDKAPAVTVTPLLGHKATRYKGKTYVLASNGGPILLGNWLWNRDIRQSGQASHEGDSVNSMWFRPGGVRIHGFRGLPMPELIQKGDKIVQYVWIDPASKPDWAMVCVRGDGRFAHNAVLGSFAFEPFRAAYGNVLMFSELEHSVWHTLNWVMDDATYQRAVKVMGKDWADNIRKSADSGRAAVDKEAYQAADFHAVGGLPKAGEWYRMELDAEKLGLVGKLVDGFAYLTKDGRALWDYSVLERGTNVVRVFSEDAAGLEREKLAQVRIAVPGLKSGTAVKVLFEDRKIVAEDGAFADDFTGTDTYGEEAGAVVGDMFGFVKDEDRELPRMMPSGTAYNYGPTSIHIYEIGD